MIEERLKKLEEAVFGKTNTKIKKYDYVRMGGIDWICYKVINDNTFLTTVKELSEENLTLFPSGRKGLSVYAVKPFRLFRKLSA